MTILGGDYEPVEVMALDLVGYQGDGTFVILNPIKHQGRELPVGKDAILDKVPYCIIAKIENNQVVNFSGEIATLHDIDGVWHRKPQGSDGKGLAELAPHTFFEIGSAK